MISPVVGAYYYHYKHNPNKGILNYAYRVEGIAVHSETEELLVVYRPLYRGSHVDALQADVNVRPLAIFMENVNLEGLTIPRFRQMTESESLAVINEYSKVQEE